MSLSFFRLTRAQLVFDALEEDDVFVLRGFAEGDDVDFMFSLCMDDRHGQAVQEAEGNEALFLVLESVILERWPLKHFLRIALTLPNRLRAS